MNQDENLHGSLVLVDPELKNDPVKGQGKVAFIKYMSQNRDEIYVGFLDGREAFYQAAELLRMKDKQAIFDVLRDNAHTLSLPDVKALYKIFLYEERGTNTARVQALEIARDNPSVWDKALDRMLPQQKQELSHHYTR